MRKYSIITLQIILKYFRKFLGKIIINVFMRLFKPIEGPSTACLLLNRFQNLTKIIPNAKKHSDYYFY